MPSVSTLQDRGLVAFPERISGSSFLRYVSTSKYSMIGCIAHQSILRCTIGKNSASEFMLIEFRKLHPSKRSTSQSYVACQSAKETQEF